MASKWKLLGDRPEVVAIVMLDPDTPPWKTYQPKIVYMTPEEYSKWHAKDQASRASRGDDPLLLLQTEV